MPIKDRKEKLRQAPVWGFHEPTITAGAATDQALTSIGQGMQDPRFGMASGLGAAAGTVRGLGNLRGRLFQPLREEGGFNVPLKKIIQDQPGIESLLNRRLGETPPNIEPFKKLGFDTDEANQIARTPLPGPREAYVNAIEDTNSMARTMNKFNPSPSVSESQAAIKDVMDTFPEINRDVMATQQELLRAEQRRRMMMDPRSGGGEGPVYRFRK